MRGSRLGGTFGSFPSTIKPYQTQDIGIEVKDVTQSSSGIVEVLEKRLRRDQSVQILVKFGPELDDYRHIRKKLLLSGIEHNPTDSHAFVNLGNQLSAHERIEVQLEGRHEMFDKLDLYLEAIRLYNDLALAYYNLANQLSANYTIRVPLKAGHRMFNQRQLTLEAIRLDNGLSLAYSDLANQLSANETIKVWLKAGDRMFDKKELYLEAIRLHNGLAEAYFYLGHELSTGEKIKVQLRDGDQEFTKE